MDAHETCGRCGARAAPDIDWCPRCYAPRPRGTVTDGLPAHMRRWYAPDDPTPPATYSRWRGGATTFGPVGRVVITLSVCLMHALLWLVLGPGGIVFIGIGYIALTGLSVWVLLHVWRRDRIT